MYDTQYLTDKYSILSLFLWVAVTFSPRNLLDDYLVFHLDLFTITIFSVTLFAICFLIITEFYYRLQKNISLPNYFINLIGEKDFKSIRIIQNGKADFSERSGFFSKIIGVPENHLQYESINKQLYASRLVHEFGHSKYRDCFFAQLYMVIAILSFIFTLSVLLNLPEPQIPEYASKEATYLWLFSLLALVISIIRFILLLRVREYRADSYATGILGERYIAFLKHQKLKSLYSEQGSKIHKAFKWLTHPSFDKRLKYISNQSKSVNPFVEGLYWPLIFFFTIVMFLGSIFSGTSMPMLITPDGVLSFSQKIISEIMVVLSIIGINLFLYGISKIQYAYLLESNGLRKALFFSFFSAASFSVLMRLFVLMADDLDTPPLFAISDIVLFFWFLALLIFNLTVLKLFRQRNHLPVTRCIWSWTTIIALTYIIYPSLPILLEWLPWKSMLVTCFIGLLLAACTDLVFGMISKKT